MIASMDHTIVYRWRIKPGREAEFEEAWSDVTRQIRAHCGSGGAELFTDPDGVYVSHARWPSPESRDACFDNPSWLKGDASQVMNDCVLERLPEMGLTSLRDLRKGEKDAYLIPTLITERLTLRALQLTDAEAIAPALMDADNMRYWSRGPIESVDAVREYMTWNVEPCGIECFAITETANTDDALGWVILMYKGKKEAEIGYILRPDAQGRGVAREAVSRAITHAFETRDMRRISADIDPDNQRSVAAIKALGFSYEGHFRATWETHIGLRDSLMFSRLSTDPTPAAAKRS